MDRKKAAAAAVLGVLGVAYAAGIYYFGNHTFPNTTVDGQPAAMVDDETAMSLVRNTAVTEDITFRVQDKTCTIPSSRILSVADEDAVRRVITDRNTFAWPVEFFKVHDLSSGRAMSCDRAALREFLDAEGVTSLDIPAVDAVLSEFQPGGAGYQVIPDSDGWKADPEEVTEFAAKAAEQEIRDIDLTDAFKVKANVLGDDAELHAQADHLNKLVNHDYTISVGDDTEVLSGEMLNGWLKESRDGLLGLDAEQLWAYTDGLQERYQQTLDARGAESGQRYIVDTNAFNNILAKKLDLVMPVPETDAERYSRMQKNQKTMDKARRNARKLKDQAKADKLVADAEASLILAPDLTALMREDVPELPADESTVIDKSAAGFAAAKKIISDQAAAEKAAEDKEAARQKLLEKALKDVEDTEAALQKALEKKEAADEKLKAKPENESRQKAAEKAAEAYAAAEKNAADAKAAVEALQSEPDDEAMPDGISSVLLINGMFIENMENEDSVLQRAIKASQQLSPAEKGHRLIPDDPADAPGATLISLRENGIAGTALASGAGGANGAGATGADGANGENGTNGEANGAAGNGANATGTSGAANGADGATPSDAAASDATASDAVPAEPTAEIVEVADNMIYLPLLEASPEFVLGYGLDYIDVNIENQHVILFENARKVMESDCVSGLPTAERRTHKGVFKIDYKQRNRILRGSQRLYASFVNYWMPFDGGIGLHDATWRGSFGGNIYKYSGSHGCVNLPLSFAKKLYARVYAGETVWVH